MNFNWEVYRELNPDLVKGGLKTQFDFVNHYNVHGKTENRKYSVYQLYPDFNPVIYSQNYGDLGGLNLRQLELHWIKHGKNEGRSYKPKNPIKLVTVNKYGLINGIDTIYWINLDRSKDRRVLMENMFKKIKVPNKRISASDGKLIPNIASNFIAFTPKNQSPGVYGCLLSHLRTIKEFYISNKNIALVLEDDISLEFMPFWKRDIRTIIGQAPMDWDIIMLHYTDIDPNNHRNLYNRWKPNICSTMAYLINKRGAQKIMSLNKNGKWFIPVKDHVADVVVYNCCNTYIYRYAYFTINSKLNSLLHNEHLELHNRSKNMTKAIWLNG
jgi:GR25 family glycosyltransferase involved in LPS biosynthesis